jgi:serine/threonine protein kinase
MESTLSPISSVTQSPGRFNPWLARQPTLVGAVQPLERLPTLISASQSRVDPPTWLLSGAPATLLLAAGPSSRATAQLRVASGWPLPMGHRLRGRYHLVQLIAKSGMSAVYRAEDTHLALRQVAIKTAGGPELLACLAAEALLLAGLSHPNLPTVHEYIEEAGIGYLIMQLVEGVTLREIFSRQRGRPLPLAQVLDIGCALCVLLAFLHTSTPPIVYGDLKPANVMLCRQGHLVLIDFGTAYVLGSGIPPLQVYTPGYAPPEQHLGTERTPQVDLYSLGTLLLELLTGCRQPYASDRWLAPVIPEGLEPPELRWLLQQMVAVDPSYRPPSSLHVGQRLSALRSRMSFPPTLANVTRPLW